MRARPGPALLIGPALLLGLTLIGVVAAPTSWSATRVAKPMAVPFLEDDYPKALTEARAKKLPIFIEFWAPW